MRSSNVNSDDVLSFFSGAGGFSYGFSQAGLRPKSGAEIDKDACATYEENVGSTCHNVDLSSIDPDFFLKVVNGKTPFAVIGGPPCQGFSTAGARDASDPRNKLIFNYLKIVDRLRPRWFFFENVEGLLTSGNGVAVASLVKEFVRIGYSVRVQKVNFAAYGVPQTRKRVLIIGNSFGIDFEFPEETRSYASGKSKKHSNQPFAPTLDQAISGL
jgi:DNA (cytosine-5)-methyltransferase 1